MGTGQSAGGLSHHRLMQSVIKLVQGRCNKLVIAGGFATPNDFVGYLNKFHTEFGIHIPDMAGQERLGRMALS